MKLYADRPARLTRQVLGDLLALLLLYVCVRVGRAVHNLVDELAGPGRDAENSARGLGERLRAAAGDVDGAPLVGDTLARPFRALAGTSGDLADSAQAYQDTVARVADLTGLVVTLIPALVVLAFWLPKRIGWIVEASAAARLLQHDSAATDLLALRALARQPMRRLSQLSPDAFAAWRDGDPAAIAALADLELAELGLHHR